MHTHTNSTQNVVTVVKILFKNKQKLTESQNQKKIEKPESKEEKPEGNWQTGVRRRKTGMRKGKTGVRKRKTRKENLNVKKHKPETGIFFQVLILIKF